MVIEPELLAFENAFGTIPREYREFLLGRDGLVTPSIRLDGVRALAHSQTKYQKEFGPPAGWSMENVFVIGWTEEGSPVVIHKRTGKVLIERRPGDVRIVAVSLAEFLTNLRSGP